MKHCLDLKSLFAQCSYALLRKTYRVLSMIAPLCKDRVAADLAKQLGLPNTAELFNQMLGKLDMFLKSKRGTELDVDKPSWELKPEGLFKVKDITSSRAVWLCRDHYSLTAEARLKEAEVKVSSPTPLPRGHAENIKCETFKRALRCLSKHVVGSMGLAEQFFDLDKGCMCYCQQCHRQRGDDAVYPRGDPPTNYGIPVGWSRISLRMGGNQAEAVGVFRKWHTAFHGTKASALRGILSTGRLAKPGDTVLLDASKSLHLEIRPLHIKKPFKRTNAHTGEKEMFDPNQIFLSPSIKYSENAVYTDTTQWKDEDDGGTYDVKMVFQVWIKPGTYAIGQETIGATRKIDSSFENSELEW